MNAAAWQRPFVEAALAGKPVRLVHTRKGPVWRAIDPEAFGPEVSPTDALPLACDDCGAGVAEPCLSNS